MFIEFFLKLFEIKQWLLAYQGQFCAWFSVIRPLTETALVFFSELFSKSGSVFLLPASQTCSMARQDFFVPYNLPSHVKYYPNSQTFRHFKTVEAKTLL